MKTERQLFTIRKADSKDAERIAEIYNHYVKTSIATFDLNPWSSEDMRRKVKSIQEEYPYLVLESNGSVMGYAYAIRWKQRKAYNHSAEVSIYFHPNQTRKGWGKALYNALFKELEKMNVHCLIAGVSLPNDGSIRFHERLGFEKVAHFREVGFKFEHWIDVAYWQLFFK